MTYTLVSSKPAITYNTVLLGCRFPKLGPIRRVTDETKACEKADGSKRQLTSYILLYEISASKMRMTGFLLARMQLVGTVLSVPGQMEKTAKVLVTRIVNHQKTGKVGNLSTLLLFRPLYAVPSTDSYEPQGGRSGLGI